MIRQFILCALVLAPFYLMAQKISTYNGPYETSAFLQNGQAVYQYYDDPKTYERIRKGPFRFVFVGKDLYKGANQVIEGAYKNDLKHGQWTYTLNYTDFKNGEYFQSGPMKLVANYVDGLPHGVWNFTSVVKVRQMVYNRSTRKVSFGPYSAPISIDLKANFVNGVLTGSLVYNMNDKINNKIQAYACLFDSQGFYHGKNVIREGTTESIFEFDHGFLFKEITRNLQSGSIKSEDNSKDLILVKQLREGQAEDSKYKLESESAYLSYLLKPVSKALKDCFFSEQWHFGEIYGDVQYDASDSYRPYQYQGLFFQSLRIK